MKTLSSVLLCCTLTTAAAAQACITPAPYGTSLGSLADVVHAPQPIGFAFPFAGSTFTDVHVSDHGIVWLSNAGVPLPPSNSNVTYNITPSTLTAFGPCIAAFWADATPGAAPNPIGEVLVDASSTRCRITWRGMYTFFNQPPAYTFQLTLHPNGEIDFVWDGNTRNYGSPWTPSAIVGVSPGSGSTLPASSDLSAGLTTASRTVFEEFAAPSTFDLSADGLRFSPANPGWTVQALGGSQQCSTVQSYGTGCIAVTGNAHELLPAGNFDLAGKAFVATRNGNHYSLLESTTASIVPPSATAQLLPLGDDDALTVNLSAQMPIPGSTTNQLTVCSNGIVTLGPVSNTIAFAPSTSDFLTWPRPAVAPMWHDFQPNATGSGSIKFEEIGGIAYLTWDDVYNWGQVTGETFQVQFDVATGDITVVYASNHNNIGNDYLVGVTAGGPLTNPGGYDLSVVLQSGVDVFDAESSPLQLSGDRPQLGTQWNLLTQNVDSLSPINIVFFGTMRSSGIPLATIGLQAPGCFIWLGDALASRTSGVNGGQSAATLAIPSNPALIGAAITAQSACLTTVNPGGLLMSNGIEGRLGL